MGNKMVSVREDDSDDDGEGGIPQPIAGMRGPFDLISRRPIPKRYPWENKAIREWNTEDIFSWLSYVGLGDVFAGPFRDHQIVDPRSLLDLAKVDRETTTVVFSEAEKLASCATRVSSALESFTEDSVLSQPPLPHPLYAFRVLLSYLLRLMMSGPRAYFRTAFVRVLRKLLGRPGITKDWQHIDLAQKCAALCDPEIFEEEFFGGGAIQVGKDVTMSGMKMKLVLTEDRSDGTEEKTYVDVSKNSQHSRRMSLIQSYMESHDEGPTLSNVGITVGPWFVEWNSSELIIPRQLEATKTPFLSCDIQTLREGHKCPYPMLTDYRSFRRFMAQLVTDWNSNVLYTPITEHDPRKANCLVFVREVMEFVASSGESMMRTPHDVVRLSKQFSQPFLEQLMKTGKFKVQVRPGVDFAKGFGLDQHPIYKTYRIGPDPVEPPPDPSGKPRPPKPYPDRTPSMLVIPFETHEDFDEFVVSCESQDYAKLHIDHKEFTYSLLENIDRYFWRRHLLDPTDPIGKPREGRGYGRRIPTGCPFSHPNDNDQMQRRKQGR